MPDYQYKAQAKSFLARNNLKFRAIHKGDKCPNWCDGAHKHGNRYRITISRKDGDRFSFDFWNSLHDLKSGVKTLDAYDALCCLSSDSLAPDTFEEFCNDFGYDINSHEAQATFRLVNRLAKQVRKFFTGSELAELREIQ